MHPADGRRDGTNVHCEAFARRVRPPRPRKISGAAPGVNWIAGRAAPVAGVRFAPLAGSGTMPLSTTGPTMQLLDIGANLGHESFQHDLDPVLQRAREHGVDPMILTGPSREGSEHA